MKSDQPPIQAVHVITVVLTLVFSVTAFHYWLPQKINQKATLVLKTTQTAKTNQDKASEVPQSLIEHIKNTRKLSASVSDALVGESLADILEEFEADYTHKAEQIISNRFKIPNFDNDNFSRDFKAPEGLKDIIKFWTYIFGVYDRNFVIFYNEDNVGIVYSVIDFSELGKVKGSDKAFKAQIIHDERRRIKRMLSKVARHLKEEKRDLKGLNKEEARIAKLLLNASDHVPVTESALHASLNYRYGFAHRMKKGIVQSGHYMNEIRRIFKERGLPEELTVIPFVESAFDIHAYSRAGAAGIWQFVEDTGKRYLRIDEYVDERYDPILAAYAAATHLANEYRLLKSWPLTVNAYNTGPGRMLQAIRQLKTTDITRIIKEFDGAGYGFDSRNYFPEILAALHVYKNREHYFGDLKTLPPMQFEYVALPAPLNIRELARRAGLSPHVITNMNPSLKPAVVAGQKKLPRGYLIKIPVDTKENIMLAMQELTHEVRYATHHVVQRGDTLKKIANRYDVSIQELATVNGLIPGQDLKKGDIIRLPANDRLEVTSLDPESDIVVPDKLNVPDF